jgi:Na+/glutamate symporter
MLEVDYGSYKYRNVGTMNDVMLTHSWIKSIDVPLFVFDMVIKHLVSKYSIQNNRDPVPCSEASRVGECCVSLRMAICLWNM